MATRVFLFLCLLGQILAKEPPDVTCLVINLESIRCMWNQQGTPEVNYTFSSRAQNQEETICGEYLSENGTNIGCMLPYTELQRFNPFHTKLSDGNRAYEQTHDLKGKVKLNPPTNLTVKNGSDLNLWFYWNLTVPGLQQQTTCVESQVRIRKNNNDWEISSVYRGHQSYCHNLPSSTARYELQVQIRFDNSCGQSKFWSDWSEPVVWGFNNSTISNVKKDKMGDWTAVVSVVSGITLILLLVVLLQNERIKIILIPPPIPKPALNSPDVEDWFHFSKGLIKERFNTNFNERACTVREYQPVSRSDSNGSDSSRTTTTTDQTDCSISIAVNEPEDTSAPFYTTPIASEEEQQVSV
ncbi:cytokine receptor common subunit gamma-like [Poeciliopsis prolifica]|uniref:cytokine receptor common subunit gamma-like n=1 Tax=Poeciliopsis prolifica TaxID=188132 RepID=UPI00072D5B19|nr:cytokine receptor common subunit gamma-like [Poeciliopsis prolifica]